MSEAGLRRCNSRGRWAFSVNANTGTPPSFANPISLLETYGLEPWEAIPWQVHLNAWSAQSPQAAAPVSPFFTTDNMIPSGEAMFIVLEYGTDGSNERCFVDWPVKGATFMVNAAFLRLGLAWLFNFPDSAPVLAGFVTPARRFSQMVSPPTFSDFRILADNSATDIPCPRRACAYRVRFSTSKVGQSYTLQQLSAGALGAPTVVVQDGGHTEDAAFMTDGLASNAAGYIPLTFGTQSIRITTSLTGGNGFTVQWLLDLG